MKAILCRRFGPPEDLVLADIDEPQPGPGEVQIAVRAAGVGYVDGLMVQGLYQEKPPLPHVPGSEFAGVVAALGSGVEDWTVGARVMGMGSSGAFGEKLIQPAALCVATPDNLDDTEAAAFCSTTLRRCMACVIGANSRRAKRYWCWAPRVVSAWPPWPWPRRSAPA